MLFGSDTCTNGELCVALGQLQLAPGRLHVALGLRGLGLPSS